MKPSKLDLKVVNNLGLVLLVIFISQNKILTQKGGGKKDYDPVSGYVQNMHRSQYQGGSVTSQAPFGTSQAHFNPYQHEETPYDLTKYFHSLIFNKIELLRRFQLNLSQVVLNLLLNNLMLMMNLQELEVINNNKAIFSLELVIKICLKF